MSGSKSNAAPGVYDQATAEALQRDIVTMRHERDAREGTHNNAPCPPPARAGPSQLEKEPQASPLPRPPKNFDPYLMNGTGPNDSGQNVAGGAYNCLIL